ncbi:metalloregulator ArsR/SmtB family transcription factor [Aliiroseovarius sp. F47248L]|uniref:ArsR/SmtB family transcription factor n=1 Tax=Aliiroseovarius sp. F47248L TaxID=2926420 RepID=UPI001FF165C9|nr:metalloregulator ArsR/SmtB family transcription factor [Aliiroseovarius sp. F47248L]MCK0138623.1 metalloregulator ArsR/SmtB family transcription factor [Aliiroseovarius sp. F47248L]
MALPVIREDMTSDELDKMMTSACDASTLLKAISHEGRLMILCHLVTGEKSVTELEHLLHARQAAVSQQLARLRLEGLVTPRRDGKTIYYSLTDERPRRILEVIYELFCSAGESDEVKKAAE